jgi:putative ATP-binding cassette transporter
LLIKGASGNGKSTLIRAIAGLWPFGEGEISIPEKQRLLFLPQKPYIPLGTLREALTYPLPGDAFSEQRLREAMRMCRLNGFADSLDRQDNWAQILSLGEQQRVAFTRVILLQPQWLFLDEATSALDEPTELALYKMLHEELSQAAIISIGHRSTLNTHNNIYLLLEGDGSWRIEKNSAG